MCDFVLEPVYSDLEAIRYLSLESLRSLGPPFFLFFLLKSTFKILFYLCLHIPGKQNYDHIHIFIGILVSYSCVL